MANRNLPAAAFGQPRAHQQNHSKRLQAAAPLHGPAGDKTMLPKVRGVGESAVEVGRALSTPFGVATTDQFTLTAHGFTVGDRVRITGVTPGGTGVGAGNYYVATIVDANTFTLSATPPNALGSPQNVTGVAATDLFTNPLHGLVAGQPVRFNQVVPAGAAAAPAVPALGTIYYVIASGLTANDFKVSATRGGATIDLPVDLVGGSYQPVGGPLLDVTLDLTAGTVTRYKTHQGGAYHAYGSPSDSLPGIQGPRGGGSRVH